MNRHEALENMTYTIGTTKGATYKIKIKYTDSYTTYVFYLYSGIVDVGNRVGMFGTKNLESIVIYPLDSTTDKDTPLSDKGELICL